MLFPRNRARCAGVPPAWQCSVGVPPAHDGLETTLEEKTRPNAKIAHFAGPGRRIARTATSKAKGTGPCFRPTISRKSSAIEPKNGPVPGLCSSPAGPGKKRPAEWRRETLFHRHALGQVPRLVDVAAAGHGDVVGQELQAGSRVTIGCRNSSTAGTSITSSASRPTSRVAFADHGDHRAAAGLDLLDVRHHLVVDVPLRHEEHAGRRADRPGRSARASSRRPDSPRRGCS